MWDEEIPVFWGEARVSNVSDGDGLVFYISDSRFGFVGSVVPSRYVLVVELVSSKCLDELLGNLIVKFDQLGVGASLEEGIVARSVRFDHVTRFPRLHRFDADVVGVMVYHYQHVLVASIRCDGISPGPIDGNEVFHVVVVIKGF